MPEHEPVCFYDQTGSQDDPIVPGSTVKRKTVTYASLEVCVRKFKELDDAGTDHTLAGEADYAPHGEESGLLTFGFQQHSVIPYGNLNPGNFQKMTATMRYGGQTYIMPAIAAWQEDRDQEFSQDEVKDINRQFDLVFLTDGLFYDEPQFLAWVASTSPNHHVYFVMIGWDEDTSTALTGYQRIVKQYPEKVHLYDMTRTTDPTAIADQMLVAMRS